MKKRLHIERRVGKVVDTKTIDVITAVMAKLLHPPREPSKHAQRGGWPKLTDGEFQESYNWSCRCLYCRLQMLYVYYNIRFSQNDSLNRTVGWSSRSRETAVNILYRVKSIRKDIEEFNMSPDVVEHIKASKKAIGRWRREDLMSRAFQNENTIDDIMLEGARLLSKYRGTRRKDKMLELGSL
ncbi:hypothetical protein LCGC14_1675760 [marine sediment metagenome]|uniref:Uncharacterized protein n=1 Tax=marine sediment metagenome TaxID=412755 RepID=A0A0F9HQR5_9ZZZZ